MDQLGISQAFAGLVIVAIAGNAVENVVGIQLAARNKMDYALSLILQSPLQIALVLAPVLVLAAPLVGATFTLVLSPLLIAVLAIAVPGDRAGGARRRVELVRGPRAGGAVRVDRGGVLVGLSPAIDFLGDEPGSA